MSYAIVFSSKTGNTGLLADTLHSCLPQADCCYFGNPNPAYQIIAQDGSVVLAGARDIQSLTTPWYSSYNTVSGEYAPNMFVPPLEGAVCLLQYEDVTIEIPLTLALG